MRKSEVFHRAVEVIFDERPEELTLRTDEEVHRSYRPVAVSACARCPTSHCLPAMYQTGREFPGLIEANDCARVMADGTDSSAPSIPTDDVGEKRCGVCKVPISIHVDKPGIGKCFGRAFTKAFESFVKSVQGLTDQLQAERSEAKKEREEAKGREVRLNVQLRELRSEVSELKGEMEFIKARCISAQSESRTQPNQDKKIKKKSVPSLPHNQTETEEDHKNSKEQTRPWADVCRGAEINESESESNESQRPSSPMSSTSKEKNGQETRITNSTKDTMGTKDTKDTKRTRTVRPKPNKSILSTLRMSHGILSSRKNPRRQKLSSTLEISAPKQRAYEKRRSRNSSDFQ